MHAKLIEFMILPMPTDKNIFFPFLFNCGAILGIGSEPVSASWFKLFMKTWRRAAATRSDVHILALNLNFWSTLWMTLVGGCGLTFAVPKTPPKRLWHRIRGCYHVLFIPLNNGEVGIWNWNLTARFKAPAPTAIVVGYRISCASDPLLRAPVHYLQVYG